MTPEEFVRAVLLAKGVNGGEAIFIGEGPFDSWSSGYNAQVVVRAYLSDFATSLDGKRFRKERIQAEIASPSPRNAMQVAEQAAVALDYVGPFNPAPGLAGEPYSLSVISGPIRAGAENGVHYASVNVEVAYGQD